MTDAPDPALPLKAEPILPVGITPSEADALIALIATDADPVLAPVLARLRATPFADALARSSAAEPQAGTPTES